MFAGGRYGNIDLSQLGLGQRANTAGNYAEPSAPGSRATPDDQLAYLSKSQWAHYMNQFAPVEDELVGEINSTKMVDQARSTAARQIETGQGSIDRVKSRYGLGGAPKGFSRVLERQQAMGDAGGTAQAVNTARVDQRERNLGLMSEMMQVGRGVASQGMSGMADVAGMAAQRDAQNAQASAANKAGRISTAASLGALALMAF